MAGRRRAWTLSETEDLIKHFDKPIQELTKIFSNHSKASIQRKLIRLRKDGKIGYKSKETTKEAYKRRHA